MRHPLLLRGQSEPTGGSRLTRRAGMYDATDATAMKSNDTPRKVAGSTGVTPNNKAAT